MSTSQHKPRWYHLTPDRFFIGLLAVQVLLLLSERFQWFAFNEKKGWTVLIAVGVVGLAVAAMLAWGLVCLCRRWRFQFGVRSLLAFLVAVSVPLGWFAWELQRARRQREAVEAIVKAGGEVFYDHQTEAADWNLIPITEPTTPRWLRELLGDDFFNEVTVVACDDTRLDDNDVRHLKELANVERLFLTGTQITDSGLTNLEGLAKLEWLTLACTRITDSGLAHLKGMTELNIVSLAHTESPTTAWQTWRDWRNSKSCPSRKPKSLTKAWQNSKRHYRTARSTVDGPMSTPAPKLRWYHLTPAWFIIGLLVVQVFLLLSEQCQWFAFNEQKGRTVLIAVGVVGVAVVVMLVWFLVSLVLRRRFQFGVRSLLVFLVAVSVSLGWFAWELQRAHRQREAAEAILKTTGEVGYDYQYPGGLAETYKRQSIDSGYLGSLEPSVPGWLRKLLGDDFFCDVVYVYTCTTEVHDDDVAYLQRLKKLKWLTIHFTSVTNDGLERLRNLTCLETLDLSSNRRVTDEGLKHLHGMKNLMALCLSETRVTDSGLAYLRPLTGLEQLSLCGTKTSDDGLKHLATLPNLQMLDLSFTGVTDDGLQQLGELTRLEYLALCNTAVTDDGLVHLRSLTNLSQLTMTYTTVSDAGLEHLYGLPRLGVLGVQRTKVTREGKERFGQAHPNCYVHR